MEYHTIEFSCCIVWSVFSVFLILFSLRMFRPGQSLADSYEDEYPGDGHPGILTKLYTVL